MVDAIDADVNRTFQGVRGAAAQAFDLPDLRTRPLGSELVWIDGAVAACLTR
jgi:hypothetical protein